MPMLSRMTSFLRKTFGERPRLSSRKRPEHCAFASALSVHTRIAY
jgi:hypothetical protein